MENVSGLIVKPNYPSLLLTMSFMGSGFFFLVYISFSLISSDYLTTSFVDWVQYAFLAAIGLIMTFGFVTSMLDSLHAALSGLRSSWLVRFTREGIHHRLRHAMPIPWNMVRDVYVENGFIGSNICFKLDSSLKLRGYSLLNTLHGIGAAERVSILRLPSYKYSFSAPILLFQLRELAPDSVHIAYRVN